MRQIYGKMMEESPEPLSEEQYQGFQLTQHQAMELIQKGGSMGFSRAFGVLPVTAQYEVRIEKIWTLNLYLNNMFKKHYSRCLK